MSEMMIRLPVEGDKTESSGAEHRPFEAPRGDVPLIRSSRRGRLAGRQALAALISADVLAVAGSLVVGQVVGDAVHGARYGDLAGVIVYLPLFLVALGGYGLYRRGRRRLVGSSFPDFSHLVHSLIVASLVMFAASGAAHRWIHAPRVSGSQAATTAVAGVIVITLFRAAARWLLSRGGSTMGSRVLVVGSGFVANHVVARLASVRNVEVVGWVDDNLFPGDSRDPGDIRQLGSLDDLAHVIPTWDIDHVIVAFSPAAGSTLASLIREMSAEVRISIVPRLFDLLSVRSHVDDLRGLPVIDVAPPSLGPADRFAKRVLDVAVSGFGLLVLSPVLLILTVAIKLTSPGPVLFSQDRTGRYGKTFRIHKFRTMRVSAENEKAGLGNDVDGPLFKARTDPRVTSVGRFLRPTSLDELPQLLNVLKGEMSLVGPRPFVISEADRIQGWAAKRFDVRPGMTGLWQVSGRSDLPFDELCRLDYSYVASWSLWWDIHILWQTPSAVWRRHGAY